MWVFVFLKLIYHRSFWLFWSHNYFLLWKTKLILISSTTRLVRRLMAFDQLSIETEICWTHLWRAWRRTPSLCVIGMQLPALWGGGEAVLMCLGSPLLACQLGITADARSNWGAWEQDWESMDILLHKSGENRDSACVSFPPVPLLLFCWDWSSFYSPGYPRASCVDQAGPEFGAVFLLLLLSAEIAHVHHSTCCMAEGWLPVSCCGLGLGLS